MRGVSNTLGASPLIGLYLDETPLSSLSLALIDVQAIDLERIEALKGPQGTLYGQGSVGGTIRFISAAPSLDSFEGELGAKTYLTKNGSWSEELTGVISIPVVEDTLALRVAASYKDKSGWIDQPGIDAANDSVQSHVRFTGLWQGSEDLSVRAMATRHRDNAGAYNIINRGYSDDGYYQIVNTNDSNPISTGIVNDYDLYNLTVNYDVGFARLTSSSSYFDVENSSDSTSTLWPAFDVLTLDEIKSSKAFTQEIRLANSDGELRWTIGAFYNDNEFTEAQGFVGLYIQGVPVQTAENSIFNQSSESISIFGDVSYSISDQLTLAFGTRYFSDEKKIQGNFFSASSEDYSNISSKISFSYAVSEDVNLYMTVSEGFRSGGLNVDGKPYDPESLISYELGAKSSLFNRRVSAEVGIFSSVYSDYQASVFNPNTNQGGIVNAAEAKIVGVDWDLRGNISSHVTLGFSGNIMAESEFTEFSDIGTSFQKGDQLDQIPKYGYSLYADFSFNWFSSADGFAGVSYNRKGKSSETNRELSGLQSDTVIETGSVGFLNAHLGGTWESITFKVFGRNITNESRPTNTSVFADGSIHGQDRLRTLGVDVSYQF